MIKILLVVAGLLLVAPAAASAQQDPPQSPCVQGGPENPPPTTNGYPPRSECAAPRATRTQAAAGQPVTVTGQCPSSNAAVTFRLDPGGHDIGSTVTNAEGRFSHTFTVPASVPVGDFQIVITCAGVQGAGATRTLPLAVVAAAGAQRAGAAPAPGGTLPRTGTEPLPLAIGGGVLIGLGVMAVIATRRRRQATA